MSLVSVLGRIAELSSDTPLEDIEELSLQCKQFAGSAGEVLESLETLLASSRDDRKLALWRLINCLSKQHPVFLDILKSKIINLCTRYHPEPSSAEYQTFVGMVETAMALQFGSPVMSLVIKQLREKNGGASEDHSALTVHRPDLHTAGGFALSHASVDRMGSEHSLQVKTLDSQMSMSVANSYTPAQPVSIVVPDYLPDSDAPQGFMKALPADHTKQYEEARRKRLREVMEKNREERNQRQEQQLLERVREAERHDSPQAEKAEDLYGDLKMPLEFPRDEFGVKIGNFPLGVKFIRDAIRSCGGAIELDVISQRISSLSSHTVVSNFGDIREFLRIHSPTFRLQLEGSQWIVRLTDSQLSGDFTWRSLMCPFCSKTVKGRNFAVHANCRSCVTVQITQGLHGIANQGPISELAQSAMTILRNKESFDDGDIDALASCLNRAAEVRRFRLGSTRDFAPILAALRVVRDRWLEGKGVTEMADAEISADDFSVFNLFRVLGRNIHRLPIPWIEMGDVVDICRRFSSEVLPPFNPPPRPADPRISLHNDYPGFLFCESEVDDEDEQSGDEAYSDEDEPTFVLAPPVDAAEAIFTAGFPRDTKKLHHRMRTAPPMMLHRVLKGDSTQTQQAMYADIRQHASGSA